ncbi:MAG: AAA family ATPase [Desulfobacter sp.]|nr:AAA family ATPase [Desulfobacter sp.]WDP83848.1 MAG: AAA family ATPase [Desulfobacter sp.]
MITVNLGTLLARQGNRVLLMDLDLGSSNLHTFMEGQDPDHGLDLYLDKQVASLDQAAVPSGIANLSIISSQHCSTEAANLYTAQKLKIIRAISSLDYDYVLLDLGAGTNFNTLDFFLVSGQGICVATSEPTAIENTFKFIKAVYFRLVKKILKEEAFAPVARHLDLSGSGLDTSFNLIDEVTRQDPGIGRLLKEKLNAFCFKLVFNQVRQKDDPDLGRKIERVCKRHFHLRFKFLGKIRHDETIQDAIQLRKNFITSYAHTRTPNDMARIARNVIREKPFGAGV